MLVTSFNELLSRLDHSFDTMRRFVADASHELRTPISVIRGEADVALSQERSAAEYRESLGVVLDESRRLSRLVDDLLNLARADAGHVRLQTHDFYLNELLAECCRSVQGLANTRGLALECCAGQRPAIHRRRAAAAPPGDQPARQCDPLHALRRQGEGRTASRRRKRASCGSPIPASASRLKMRPASSNASTAPERPVPVRMAGSDSGSPSSAGSPNRIAVRWIARADRERAARLPSPCQTSSSSVHL